MLSFPPFRIEPSKGTLWKGQAEVPLRRKPFAILRYFAEHPQRLVTHREIVEAIWGDITVSESLLRTHVRDLRQVLGDGIIETVVGHGYRFVPAVAPISSHETLSPPEAPVAGSPSFVGREQELRVLGAAFDRTLLRKREIVFITGDAGIGKTTLVHGVLSRAASRRSVWVLSGRCVEQYGSGEPYLPILAALGRLCRGPDGSRVIDILERRAPNWLVQLPGVVPDEKLDSLQRRMAGPSQARMLRELAEALEVLSTERPVILAIDDLHWSDTSTLELIATLAAWNQPARLLVVGTCRRTELAKLHPLTSVMAELAAHGSATTLLLDGLSESELEQFLRIRYSENDFPSDFSNVLQAATGGNPLYMVALLDDLEHRGLLARVQDRWRLVASVAEVAASRPETVMQLVGVRIERLDPFGRQVLLAASVAGARFTAGVVAHALEESLDDVDSCCEVLAKERRFLRSLGTERWPDGSLQTLYAFGHVLYQHAALSLVGGTARRNWHRRIADCLEAGHAEMAANIASELAAHFEQGENLAKAAWYHVAAGECAAERFSSADAFTHFERAQVMLEKLPETRERDVLELRLLGVRTRVAFAIAPPLGMDALEPLARAKELATRLGDQETLASVLISLQLFRLARPSFGEVVAYAATTQAAADRLPSPYLQAQSRLAASVAALFRGDLSDAERELTEILATRLDPKERPRLQSTGAPAHPIVVSGAYLAVLKWLLGQPDAAVSVAKTSLAEAEMRDDPYSLGIAWWSLAMVHRWRNDARGTLEAAARAAEITAEYGLVRWWNRAMVLMSWARSRIDREPSDHLSIELESAVNGILNSAPVMRTCATAPFVETCEWLGQRERGQREVTDALAYIEASGERAWEPEIQCLRGELATSVDRREAIRCFETAIEIAERQSSKSFQLRATLRLHRLLAGSSDQRRVRGMLARVYGTFQEGFDTGDVSAARSILSS